MVRFFASLVALIASVAASEFWLARAVEAHTFGQMLNYQYVATVVAIAFGARGLGRRLLAGFLVWCVFSVHIMVLGSQGRIDILALLSPYTNSSTLEWFLSLMPFA